ncbi:hypothetical protein ACLOJK_004219, partial [Asimina triloba]
GRGAMLDRPDLSALHPLGYARHGRGTMPGCTESHNRLGGAVPCARRTRCVGRA